MTQHEVEDEGGEDAEAVDRMLLLLLLLPDAITADFVVGAVAMEEGRRGGGASTAVFDDGVVVERTFPAPLPLTKTWRM